MTGYKVENKIYDFHDVVCVFNWHLIREIGNYSFARHHIPKEGSVSNEYMVAIIRIKPKPKQP